MLLCGSDLLESFLVNRLALNCVADKLVMQTPNLWSQADMDFILGELGVACIQRIGLDGEKLVNSHELFSKHKVALPPRL